MTDRLTDEQRCFGECGGEHRQGTGRRWCFDCTEWCYDNPDMFCVQAEAIVLRAALAAEREKRERLEAVVREAKQDLDRAAKSVGSVRSGADVRCALKHVAAAFASLSDEPTEAK